MQSELPKVLFPVLGRPMIHWVLDALEEAGVGSCVVVVGYRGEAVQAELSQRSNLQFALQAEQLGTGHAVQMCRPQLEQHTGPTLVVAGDSPLIQPQSIRSLLDAFSAGDYACLLGTLLKQDPTGLGRIVRDDRGGFARIVEQKDASESERAIQEVNMSTYLFDAQALLTALAQLSNDNAQGEYYLTDCPEILLRAGYRVDALPCLQPCEALSINTLNHLAEVETQMQAMGYVGQPL